MTDQAEHSIDTAALVLSEANAAALNIQSIRDYLVVLASAIHSARTQVAPGSPPEFELAAAYRLACDLVVTADQSERSLAAALRAFHDARNADAQADSDPMIEATQADAPASDKISLH